MTGEEPIADLGTYELRVHGELGPLLLSALPHEEVTRVPEHSLLVTEVSDQTDLLEIVRLIIAVGLEVDSVRGVTCEGTHL